MKNAKLKKQTDPQSATLSVEGPMRHSKPGFEGVNDKCETLNQSRKDPEVEVRSAALATQEPSVHEVTKSHLAHHTWPMPLITSVRTVA